MITVKRYRPADFTNWNVFVAASANATFILDRKFLEYHKDRFTDHSLFLYQNSKLIAVFPGNQKAGNIFSHGGLTYGGLIVGPKTNLFTTLSCFYHLVKYYYDRGFSKIVYKPVPSFFHTTPVYHDMYALFLLRARLTAMNIGFILDLNAKSTMSKHHMRQMMKAQKNNVKVVKDPDCVAFWNQILVPHLAHRFHTKPVHTIEEIELLRKRFPTNILQYNALIQGKLVAGTTIFLGSGVAHTQYIAANEVGRQTGSLDYLFWHLITHELKDIHYFSFGTTNMGSPDGRALSHGLVAWKEKFGTYMVPYPCYDIETKTYRALEAYK